MRGWKLTGSKQWLRGSSRQELAVTQSMNNLQPLVSQDLEPVLTIQEQDDINQENDLMELWCSGPGYIRGNRQFTRKFGTGA